MADQSQLVELTRLLELFYDAPDELAQFAEVPAASVPADYRKLLDHERHMTVTVEDFHRTPVDVRVLDTYETDRHYARKILLCRQSDGAVVQYGIMRLNLRHVSDEVRSDIRSQRAPLGRILIEHGVLRDVHLLCLWRVAAGDELATLFDVPPGTITYGRTAWIGVDGEGAVELLEIVTPVP